MLLDLTTIVFQFKIYRQYVIPQCKPPPKNLLLEGAIIYTGHNPLTLGLHPNIPTADTITYAQN